MKTVRIWFSKTGRATYISHLDLNRVMIRAVRRAHIPLWYTEGFNRHPYVTFAAPLSLGYAGLRETMDLRLEEELPMEKLVRRLNACMPEGLRVLEAAEAVHKVGDIAAARYRMNLSCPRETVEAFWQQDAIEVDKRTKKKTYKTIDLKPILEKAEAVISAEGDQTVVELLLPCGSTLSINPSLVMEALERFTGREIEGTVCRLDVYDGEGRPFC